MPSSRVFRGQSVAGVQWWRGNTLYTTNGNIGKEKV